ncbi:MAG: hypothetical protein CM15mP63_1090 [Gammaproteobacteria bacterium]|nr:MAG: hypothetical protein CM15mP63_1090 [Gammaproteobacteria bacterium]
MNLKLGITLNYRTIDTSLYQRRVDLSILIMMVMSYPQSQSPGSELYAMFHSSSSERRGSFNVGGINDKDVDKLIDEIIYSKKEMTHYTASHLLDRILWNDFYMYRIGILANIELLILINLIIPKNCQSIFKLQITS